MRPSFLQDAEEASRFAYICWDGDRLRRCSDREVAHRTPLFEIVRCLHLDREVGRANQIERETAAGDKLRIAKLDFDGRRIRRQRQHVKLKRGERAHDVR